MGCYKRKLDWIQWITILHDNPFLSVYCTHSVTDPLLFFTAGHFLGQFQVG